MWPCRIAMVPAGARMRAFQVSVSSAFVGHRLPNPFVQPILMHIRSRAGFAGFQDVAVMLTVFSE
jgi:hypothetical protein